MANQAADASAPVRTRSGWQPVFQLRGSPAYKAWLAGLTERSLISTSVMVRDALAMWAQSRGYPSPPRM